MKPHRFTSKMPPESKAKGQSTSLIQNWRSPWRAMEVSEKARLQKRAALVAAKRSIGGTSEWQFGKWGTPWLHERFWKKRWAIKSRCRGCWCLQTLAFPIVYLFLRFDPRNGLNRTSSESFSKFTTSVFLPENKNPVSKLAHVYILPTVSKMHVLKSAEWYIEQRSKTISRHFAGSC